MIVLDASALIAHLDGSAAHHERAGEILSQSAEADFGASTLTLAEVLVGPAQTGRLDVARAALDELEVQELTLGADAPAQLAWLRAESGLKLPDCCVVLAARSASAAAIVSFDDHLVVAAERAGLSVMR